MRVGYKNCIHCGVIYTYQSSGEGCHRDENDDKYCPSCKKALLNTLRKIPKKFTYRWVETDDVTKEEALSIIKKNDEEQDRRWKKGDERAKKCKGCELLPPFRLKLVRAYMPLVDMDTCESSNQKDFVYNNNKYFIRWWKSKPNDYKITKEVRWNLETDKQDNRTWGYERNE